MSTLIHGGDLHTAAQQYGHPVESWLDLSTGINAHGYPIPTMPQQVWQQLPYEQQSFLQAAQDYYGTDQLIMTAGSQPVIELLPKLLTQLGNDKGILIPDIGYQEHRHAWQQTTQVLDYSGLDNAVERIDKELQQANAGHLLIINPNNPSGQLYGRQQIYLWAEQLRHQQGYLIVDEAFIDCQPEASCVQPDMPDNLVILRSFGKFFGLAGVRLGAVIAAPKLLKALHKELGIWRVNGPAQAVATSAYNNRAWQQNMRQQLRLEQPQQRAIWQSSLQALGAKIQADTPLFRSFIMPLALAEKLHKSAAKQAILTRPVYINQHLGLLRLGNIDITNQSHLQHCNKWLQSLT